LAEQSLRRRLRQRRLACGPESRAAAALCEIVRAGHPHDLLGDGRAGIDDRDIVSGNLGDQRA
jgi:hypothetical protein